MKRYNLAGERFGRLVVKRFHDVKGGRYRWFCRCDCGGSAIVNTSNLIKGNTLGCGCVRRERTGDANRRHGATKSTEYKVWLSMRQRCHQKNNKSYHRYGGRGIRICKRWQSFENFLADMGRRPSQRHTLDRRDNDGNYEPSNCRWATSRVQANNTSRNRKITIRGKSMNLNQWCRHFKVRRLRVHKRLAAGWPVLAAFTRPPRQTTMTKE